MRWTSELAYVVGLITTDGNLSKDGRHIELTSKDLAQVETFSKLLNLRARISAKRGSYGTGKKYFRVQFGDVKLYRFLLKIGLIPNKTRKLGKLKIPDQYFADFLRGHLDGDGYTYSYWDKRWKNSFMLYTGFVSASKPHIMWLQERIKRLYGLTGAVKPEDKSTFSLKFAKRESMVLLKRIYYKEGLPCLQRKHSKIMQSLGIIKEASQGGEIGKLAILRR